jgi:hypothetical protein
METKEDTGSAVGRKNRWKALTKMKGLTEFDGAEGKGREKRLRPVGW